MPENEAIIRKLEEEIENISRFPDENPHSVIRVSFGGELLFANSSARNTLIKNFDHNGSFVDGKNADRFGGIFESVRKAMDGDETYRSETHIIGGRIYACAFVPINEHEYVNVYGTDITDSQKKIEGLARFPEENPHSVIRISGDGEIIFANAPAKGQILKELGVKVGQKIPDEIYLTVKETLGSGDYLDVNHNLGDRIYACTFVPVIEHSYVNIYGVDITEKINAQEETEQVNQELIQAEKMSSLGVVISGIAHEIRNPLQVIMAMSESIVDDDNLPRIQGDAQEIIDASHRISEIVSDLSTHARDARTLGRSSINLNDVADKAMEISKHTRNLKSVKVVKDYAKSPIVMDQGIKYDAIGNGDTVILDADLLETQFMIEIDNRFGSIWDPKGASRAAPSFVDDDNVATYLLSPDNNLSYFGKSSTAMSNEVIVGPRGIRLEFLVGPSTDLNSSTYLFTQLGSTATLGSAVYQIDTTVRITGVSTGYRVDLPIRFVKKQ